MQCRPTRQETAHIKLTCDIKVERTVGVTAIEIPKVFILQLYVVIMMNYRLISVRLFYLQSEEVWDTSSYL